MKPAPAPASDVLREALGAAWDALLAANRLGNVLWNLTTRFRMDGTVVLEGRDMDQLRDVRLQWEVAERAAIDVIRPLLRAPAPQDTGWRCAYCGGSWTKAPRVRCPGCSIEVDPAPPQDTKEDGRP